MSIAIDPGMIGGFLSFMSNGFQICPHCKKKIRRAQTIKARDKKKSSEACPFCKTKIK